MSKEQAFANWLPAKTRASLSKEQLKAVYAAWKETAE